MSEFPHRSTHIFYFRPSLLHLPFLDAPTFSPASEVRTFFAIFCVSIYSFLHATKNVHKNRPTEIQLTSCGTAVESWQQHVRSAVASQRSGHAVRHHVIGFDRHFEKHNAQSGENSLDSENRLHPRKQVEKNILVYCTSMQL